MKLSQKERDIVAAIELRAYLSIEDIRKETGYREHTIRYSIRRLTERGILSIIPVVNVVTMGYTMHNVFFSLGAESKNVKQKLIEALKKAPEVVWLAEFGGDYQYGLGLCVRHIMRIPGFLQRLSDQFGNIFFEKSVSTQFSSAFLPRKYLTSKKIKQDLLPIIHETERVDVDDLDKKILRALSTHAELSRRQLALKLQMPLSTLELRIRKLEDRKVVTGYTFLVDTGKLGMQHFKLLIFAKGIRSQLSRKILAFAVQHPNVTLFIECFGGWDYELNVEVEKAEDTVQIIQELYEFAGGDVLTVKALSHFRDLKFLTHPADDAPRGVFQR